jgi:hypothetical protein
LFFCLLSHGQHPSKKAVLFRKEVLCARELAMKSLTLGYEKLLTLLTSLLLNLFFPNYVLWMDPP